MRPSRDPRILPILPLQAQLFLFLFFLLSVLLLFFFSWVRWRRDVKFGEHVQADREKGGLRKLLGSTSVSMGAKRSDREGDGVCYGAFVFVFAFAFSILPPIHLCTSWFSSSLYLYCVLVLCYGCFPHLSSSSFPLQVLPSLFVSFKQNKKKKLTSSRSYLNSLAVQQILGRDLKMCIAKSRNSNVQTIEEEQDAYSYGLP